MDGMSDKQLLEREIAVKAARFIQDQKGQDVTLIDLQGKSSIADYFLIATVSSFGQLKGLVKNLQDFFHQEDIYSKTGSKHLSEDIWTLLDCDFFIVHLMTKEARDFYALERLWFEGNVIPLDV